MSDESDNIVNISDSSVPNAGRVYDYLLGGNYNFPIDQKIADQLEEKIPFIKEVVRIIRWFMGIAIDQAFSLGFTKFLDYASGLPTRDHIHYRIPKDLKYPVKIIYSDIDPVTVQIGRKIIVEEGIQEIAKYEVCDCRKPETLFESESVQSSLGNNCKVVIGLSGIFWFLTDEQIKNTLTILYEWAGKGSILYFNDFNSDNAYQNKEATETFFKLYKEMNQPIYARTRKTLETLIKPWKIRDPGLLLLEEWLAFKNKNLTVKPRVQMQLSKSTGGSYYGGILEK